MDQLFTHAKLMHALEIASFYHNGLWRKSDPTLPAMVHPFAVALLVATYKRDPEVISAAILHDTLEDTAYTAEQMEADFGANVVHLVKGVSLLKSECNGQTTWREKKHIYIEKLSVAEFDHMLICSADKIHNLSSLVSSYHKQGDTLWEMFNGSPKEYFWYYNTVLTTLKKRFDHPFLDQLGQLIKLAEPMMNQSPLAIEK